MSYFNGQYAQSMEVMPLQMIPLKKKDEKWKKDCMDALETIGRNQYFNNLHLIENYEMIKGKFIFSHYLKTEGYTDMVNQLSTEFELPNYLRHYDIIGPVINVLSGEWQKRPDIFRVKQTGEQATNEYLRKKQEMTSDYVFNIINTEINKKLADKGIDPNKTDFASDDEKKQYMDQISQMKASLTPKGIQEHMDTEFLTLAENWGQHQLEYDRERFNIPQMEKIEFEDALTADRCFRHFRLSATSYEQETWNPVNTFFHKSPTIKEVENGDFVGRCFNISLNTIIDRYGYMMDKETLDLLRGEYSDDEKKWVDSKYNWVYSDYMVPFAGFPTYDIMKQSWNQNIESTTDIPWLEAGALHNARNPEDIGYLENQGFYFVTEGYFKSLKKILKITYIDDETGQLAVKLVDENYIIPEYFVESERAFDNEHDINTYVETWVPEVWQGIKINTGVDKNVKKDIYLAIRPCDFQFKGDDNIYGAKLPVCGEVFSVRNSRSSSLVDMCKPFQIGFNMVINQLYHLAEKEIGMFMIFDVNMLPNSKDWGGEDSWDKWMLVAKNIGMLPADTSPQNVKNSLAATGGFLPKIIDLNLASQMVSRMTIAKFFQDQLLRLVGFNDARLGEFTQSDTNKGIEQGVQASYNQTESYFTNFSNYLRRVKNMNLNIAQYVQSKNKDVSFTYIKSDFSRAFIKVMGTDLLLADLGVFVVDSKETVRQIEFMRQYALNNNTAGLTPLDVFDVISMNNPREIRKQLEISYNALLAKEQQGQQLQQQQLEQQKELTQNKLERDDTNKEKDRENKLDIAYINNGSDIINSEPAQPQDDSAKMAGVAAQQQNNQDANTMKGKKIDLERDKAIAQNQFNIDKLQLEREKLQVNTQIQNNRTESAAILKGVQKPNKKKQ